jgi:hypothetical protein
MCVVSNVSDFYGPKFPQPTGPNFAPDIQGIGPLGPLNPFTITTVASDPALVREVARLGKLIEDFRKAMVAAELLDELMDQPNCVDPEKAKLVDRVNELEAKLRQIQQAASLNQGSAP